MGIETDMGCDTVVAVRRNECGGKMSALVDPRGAPEGKYAQNPPLYCLNGSRMGARHQGGL